jgi:hypothetical protein
MPVNKKLLRRQLAGFKRFNAWEREYDRVRLPQQSLEEKWELFEGMFELVRELAPEQNERLVRARLNLLADLRRKTVKMEARRKRGTIH